MQITNHYTNSVVEIKNLNVQEHNLKYVNLQVVHYLNVLCTKFDQNRDEKILSIISFPLKKY